VELNQQFQVALVTVEVETRIRAQLQSELACLPASARKDVLLRVLVGAIAEVDAAATREATAATNAAVATAAGAEAAVNGKVKATERAPVNGSAIPGKGTSIWEKVLAYLQAHPGRHHYVAVAEAVFPEKMTPENRDVFLSTLSTVLRRRCVNKLDSKDPYFRWLKDGKFRLATDEERAKSLEKKAREATKKE
jgi:hypothetical protein